MIIVKLIWQKREFYGNWIRYQIRSTLGIIAFSLFTITANANDTAFGGSGASPMPIDQPNIKMVAETIVITGQGLNKDDMGGSWHFTCDFTFKNLLDKSLTIKMGFPFPVHDEFGNFAVPTGRHLKRGDALVYDFLVTIDGQVIQTQRRKIKANQDKGLFYKDAYLWNMKFLPLQTVKIHHNYTTGATFDVMGFHWVSYVLKTGGLWKDGRIGHTYLEVIPNTPTRLCSELDPKEQYLKPTPPGIKIHGQGKMRQYSWDLKNFHPKDDLSLCLQTGRNYVRYKIIYPILQLREDNGINLQQMTVSQLKMLKNTIYAQYGRQFQSSKLQEFFDQQWWYESNPNYSDSLLTVEDKKALAIIQQMESRK